MSDAIFPALPGLAWSVFKRPVFSTAVQTAVNLSELRTSFSATPVYRFRLSFSVLRDDTLYDELHQLAGFFLAHRGRFDSWRYRDPDDHQAVQEPFGVGDSARTSFPLMRRFGAFSERVAQVEAIDEVRVNAVAVPFEVDSAGVVSFEEAPAAGSVLDWSGSYWYRCRFAQDEQEFEQFMHRLWSAQSVEFLGNLGTKL